MLIDETTYAPGQADTTTKLKPSQAMRIGAALRPQCSGILFHNGASCAMGAAFEGATGRLPSHENDYTAVFSVFPVFRKIKESIWTMNDHSERKYSREAIADWLEARGL